MFYDLFTVNKLRYVIASNVMHYPNGLLHPDRILPYHDIVAVINGFCEIYQNDQRFLVRAGDFIILPAEYHHYGLQTSPPNTLLCYMHIKKEDGDMHYTSGEQIPIFKNTDSQVLLPTIIHAQSHLHLIEKFKNLSDKIVSPAPYSKLSAEIELTKLLIDLSSISIKTHLQNADIINSCMNIMRDNTFKLTLDDASKLLNISKSTLTRHFKQATGTSFHNYFMDIRLNSSCDLLQNTRLTIEEISSTLGFCNEFHFRSCFKKKYNCTPNAYRNNPKLHL